MLHLGILLFNAVSSVIDSNKVFSAVGVCKIVIFLLKTHNRYNNFSADCYIKGI